MSGGGAQGAKTVLVVEDNPGDARLVEVFLRTEVSNPFRILHADRLSQALACLDTEAVDVVLLDLSLPDSFGLDTLARLRQPHPLVPVVVLTGTNDEVLALDSLRKGAQDYLVKGQGDGEVVRRSVHYAIERARVAAELRQSEARFRAVFANAGVGVAVTDTAGTLIEVNPAFCAMLGYDGDEMRALTWQSLTHPEDVGTNQALQRDMVAGRRDGYQLLKRYLAKDGHTVWGFLTVTAVRDADTNLFRFSVAVIEDVTERKRLEDEMRLAATVFANTGEGLFVTDAACAIIHVNPAFSDITGYAAEDVLGKNPRMLASGRHGDEFYERMWQALRETGKWQGEIWDRRKSGEMFAVWQNIAAVRDADGAIANYVAVISDITSRKEVEERLSYQANHDPLTRLPNRTLFQERLNRALARAHRNQNLVALLFVDLDRFKQVNDTLGHLAGDILLQQVAERLGGSVRQGDTVARLSGDEFTVILEDIQDARDAAAVAHKILRLMAEPFDLSGHPATISSSIGVALYPADAGEPQALIKLADAAMYRAKHSGRNGCRFHSEAVNAQAFERLALESALRLALERHELEVHYQPVFDARTGHVAALEALLRWRHPEVGMVVPAQFVSLAEETGLILPIGQWVMETVCAQAKAWRDQGFASMEIGINVSGRQLRQPDMIELVAAALEHSRLPPATLVVEVPEGSVAERGQDTGSVFARLSALGVGLSIDEFGAGYSSLAFLRRLPAGSLKMAQAFVRNVGGNSDDAEIAAAIIAVARGLHMTVVAPGVETEEQLSFLVSCGCDRVQGYLLARPMAAKDISEFLERGEIPPVLAKRIRA
ncbi:MAG: EAL domain-containing protein [Magnetospirillum sp.]|nr:EAL domain-containing protein [Magnetospirillum sp.]